MNTPLLLEQIINRKELIDALPEEWLKNINIERFSDSKTLFDYQVRAVENALKALYLYFDICKADKSELFRLYKESGLKENLDYLVRETSNSIFNSLLMYKEFKIENNKVSFEHFINRMSFWMATGSGKTIIIIKLIEILDELMSRGVLPKKEILFLTHRDDLIRQFEDHVNEFNAAKNKEKTIKLMNLRFWDPTNEEDLSDKNKIVVYYYRSDLLFEEEKEKIISYKDYENEGNWFIFLDEAHKGTGGQEESRRQIYSSIMSRNGFIFNFSATFVDPRDYVTCVANFNLSEFIRNGYGKHIYLSADSIKALSDRENNTTYEKQKVLLKIFILLASIIKHYKELEKISLEQSQKLYHKPLLLVLVDKVNTKDSDLELFFTEVSKLVNSDIDPNLFEEARNELIHSLFETDKPLQFEDLSLDVSLKNTIKDITIVDILEHVFNSRLTNTIEVLKIPGNKQELMFKLKSAEKPFALVKIGDVYKWEGKKLHGYEVVEKFEESSIFENLDEREDITMLLGSRAFYEGWDSNRPNVILYINIGVGKDAKKFVLQSLGRGVRIEPLPNQRKRAEFLVQEGVLTLDLYKRIKEYTSPLETLFIFGTKSDNLELILETLEQQRVDTINIGHLFSINKNVVSKPLLIPTFKTKKILDQINDEIISVANRFKIHPSDYELFKVFTKNGNKLSIISSIIESTEIETVKLFKLIDNFENLVEQDPKYDVIGDLKNMLVKLLDYISIETSEFNKLKQLEDEIRHYNKISIVGVDEIPAKLLINRIENMSKYKEKLEELGDKVMYLAETNSPKEHILSEIIKTQIPVDKEYVSIEKSSGVDIYYFENHYYNPLLVSSNNCYKVLHTIRHESESSFIVDLYRYLKEENNLFKEFDWWCFSKLVERVDNISIPYFSEENQQRPFSYNPDFIFWFCKGEDYTVVFVDPKSTEYIDGYKKIEGFSKIFEEEVNGIRKSKIFRFGSYKVRFKLALRTLKSSIGLLNRYKEYWIKDISDLAKLGLDHG